MSAISSRIRPGRGGGPSKEVRALVQQRTEELEKATTTAEKKFIEGRWNTSSTSLRNTAVRRRELHSRSVPKKLAKASLYIQPEDTDTGIELDAREVADRVTQADMVEGVTLQTQRKHFDLQLTPLGPYKIDFSANGTHLLLGGLRGHIANMHWKNFALQGEVQLKDKVNDLKYLVDHSMYAVAQKKYVYMYTKEGAELHILSSMAHMDRLAYLPKHMLLAASSSLYSTLQYMDISTGQEVSCKPPAIMKNPTSCLAVNATNGVVASTDLRGVVKFWSPSVVDPLLQLKGHQGAVEDICFHSNGRFFLTLGGDHKLKVWDVRTLRTLDTYAVTYTFQTMDISTSGLVALGGGTNIQIWRGLFSSSQPKPTSPYLKFGLGYGNIAERVRFCPYEDVLGVGHSQGFSSLLVPGSGEANPDFYAANPHETERHRKERVVSTLLDKLPPDMISMDVQIPGVNEERLEEYNAQLQANRKAKMIREKKLRLSANAQASKDAGPTGVTGAVGHDDELEEEIGFKATPRTKVIKTKQEKARERKMKAWDKKDSSDKVRSKQAMRVSRVVQRKRAAIRREERIGKYDRDALSSEEKAALDEVKQENIQQKKRKREDEERRGEDFGARYRLLEQGGGGKKGKKRSSTNDFAGADSGSSEAVEEKLFELRRQNAALRRLIVIAAKEDWIKEEKASCCLRAGIVYLILSLVLWILVLFQTLVVDIGDMANFRRYYQGNIFKTIAFLYRQRQNKRNRTRQFFRQRRKERKSFREELKEMESRQQILDDTGFGSSLSGLAGAGGGGGNLLFRDAFCSSKGPSPTQYASPTASTNSTREEQFDWREQKEEYEDEN